MGFGVFHNLFGRRSRFEKNEKRFSPCALFVQVPVLHPRRKTRAYNWRREGDRSDFNMRYCSYCKASKGYNRRRAAYVTVIGGCDE